VETKRDDLIKVEMRRVFTRGHGDKRAKYGERLINGYKLPY
jgi:hypothetical protein